MKEERLLVLNMLNEGKITADEACKLLAALKGEDKTNGEFGEKVGKYACDIRKKVSKLAKEAEPTVKKYAEAVGDKFEDIKENLKGKKSTAADEEEIIIVDETEEADGSSDDTNI
ncbi:MAG: hypothetical protein LUD81_00265 [Clostridiales bacterium]|nr:hypothetical protein [Clostridiales bacterium]